MKAKTYSYNLRNYSEVLNLLNKLNEEKKTYQLRYTGYTMKITIGNCIYLFADAINTNDFFSACNKVKKDVKDTGEFFEENIQLSIDYFKHSLQEFRGNLDLNCVYNIDIKKAYATTLLNKRLISNETFLMLDKLAKQDRLKVVGALATQTIITEIVNGEVIENPVIKCDTNLRNCFFAICKEVGEIMNNCATIAGDDFLFFWVDGIYLSNYRHAAEIKNYLTSVNYSYSDEILINFNISTQAKCNKVIFCKPKDISACLLDCNCENDILHCNYSKVFNLPFKQENYFKKLKLMLNKPKI